MGGPVGEAHSREPTSRPLLNHSGNAVAILLEKMDEVLRVAVVRDGNCEVRISGESRLGAGRYGEATDQCEFSLERLELLCDETKLALEVVHDERGIVMDMPSQSPSGAPGRWLIQDSTTAWISASVASGWSRRCRSPRMRLPISVSWNAISSG